MASTILKKLEQLVGLKKISSIAKRNKEGLTLAMSLLALLTSATQFVLTHYWHQHDVRALFVVHDPEAHSSRTEVLGIVANAGKLTEVLTYARLVLLETKDKGVTATYKRPDVPEQPIVLEPSGVRTIPDHGGGRLVGSFARGR